MPQAFRVEDQIEDKLVNALARAVRSGDFEPPQLPQIAVQVLELTRDPNVSMRQIGRLMARDQLLTAKVLHMANSAFYPGGGNIGSPARAMAHIGLDGLKQILFAAAFKGSVFRSKDYQQHMNLMWFHSIACAVAADYTAKARKKPMAMAFVGGLMHDIGMPMALSTIIKLQRRDKSLAAEPSTVMALVERVHAQLGGLVASRWGLPDDLKSVISNHHRADVVKGVNAELVRVVAAGDAICRALYLGYERPEKARQQEPESIIQLQRVGIDPNNAAKLCKEVEAKADHIKATL